MDKLKEIAQPPAPQHTTSSAKPILIAVGAIFMVGGLFMVLAAYEQLPSHENEFSHLGDAAKGISFGVMGFGGILIVVGFCKKPTSIDSSDAPNKPNKNNSSKHKNNNPQAEEIDLEEWDSDKHFSAAKALIDSGEYLKCPNPPGGKSKAFIFMVQNPPVVIKTFNAIDDGRFESSQLSRNVCKKHNLDHLEVPESCCYTFNGMNHMIEQRLPNQNCSYTKGMWYYYQHRAEFGPVARQFVRFLCHVHSNVLGFDFVGNAQDNPLTLLVQHKGRKAEVPRFDNLFPYKDKLGVHKLALADCEGITHELEQPSDAAIYSRVITSIQLFPYHYAEILEEANLLTQVKIDENNANLTTLRDTSLLLYDTVCETAAPFYTQFNAHEYFQISNERKAQLIDKIKLWIKENGVELNQTNGIENEIIIPLLLKIEENMNELEFPMYDDPIIMMQKRMITTNRPREISINFNNNNKEAIEKFFVKKFLPMKLVQYIFSEMAGHEIAHYQTNDNGNQDVLMY